MLTVGVVDRIVVDRIAIWVESQGGYTIIELDSSARVEQGDVMCWSVGYVTGSCTYQNVTKGWDVRVRVQQHDVPIDKVWQQLTGEGARIKDGDAVSS